MRLIAVESNRQRLDGGAMFGNAPRALWERLAVPDQVHRIELACRCLLVMTDDGRCILLEAGIGACFPPDLADRYGVTEPTHRLLASLEALGMDDGDIDVVVLSHLHFDHAGGLLAAWQPDSPARLLFPRARYVVGADAMARAAHPHLRDRASFLPELVPLLHGSGRLELVEGDRCDLLPPGWRLHRSDGHTPGMILTEIPTVAGPLLYCADLCPGQAWVHLPMTMGYDRAAERLIDEKSALWRGLAERDGWLFFAHDPQVASAKLARDERGRYGVAACNTLVSPNVGLQHR